MSPPRPFVLLLDSDPASRRVLAAGLIHAGFDVLAGATAGEALVALVRRVARPTAIVVDPAVPDLERLAFGSAPVVLLGDEPTPVARHARALVPRDVAPADLAAVLAALQRGEPPPRPARFPLGTGGFRSGDLVDERRPGDLHAFAVAKLGQYFGERRGAALLAALLQEVSLARIATTADLRAVATRLAMRGQVESAVASLLSGRATLIDSEDTLRSTRR